MKRRHMLLLVFCACAAAWLGGCGETGQRDAEAAVQTEEKDSEEMSGKPDKVASPDEMSEVLDVVEEGMEPVYGESIKDGTYAVTADSSSAMFPIEACELTVKNGEMTAVMTMGGTGYLYLYMGTGEEAAEAPQEDFIPFVENGEGKHTYEVPVEALDQGIDCAAFSKRKEKWYDRQIVFRADSLPFDAFSEGTFVTADSLGLADGNYLADVTLSGGSGRASVESPVKLTIEGGQVTAGLVWSSPNYDYMLVGEEKYLPINTEGNSAFQIPVEVFDWKLPIKADTTAMSESHEIEYVLKFDSESIRPAQ